MGERDAACLLVHWLPLDPESICGFWQIKALIYYQILILVKFPLKSMEISKQLVLSGTSLCGIILKKISYVL